MSDTAAVVSSESTGSPFPLAYGIVWATGKQAFKYMLQNTGDSKKDYTRIVFYLLGLGEWDDCLELWINDDLIWQSATADATQFHFHRGSDAVIGSGLSPLSIGPDQGVDSFWNELPTGVQRQTFNRCAYYAIRRKQPIANQTNKHQNDASQWTDINPVGLWKARRCRIFNADGAMTGYAWTMNPAWHIVDALLARKVQPDYNIGLSALSIPATAMPWAYSTTKNSAYAISTDGTAPVVVAVGLAAGENISLTVEGSITGVDDQVDGPAGHTTATMSNMWPSHYITGLTSASAHGGVVGAFTDAAGNVVQAVFVGAGATLTVPAGATQLQLGVNDNLNGYYNNLGKFFVSGSRVVKFPSAIDDLSDAARARFDWESIYEAASYFSEILANGRRRFIGNYFFSSQTSLTAVLEQMMRCCRSSLITQQGVYQLICDKPRSSMFYFTREHLMPGSLTVSDQELHAAPNRIVGKFRDIQVPVAAEIASITCADRANPTITTVAPHPFAENDRIAIGDTGTTYDRSWVVKSVPDGDSVYTLTLISQGSNFPASVGAGGRIGLLYSRMKERAPQFDHKQNQLARGVLGLNLSRVRNRVRQELDFGVCTFDQVSRLSRYELRRILGVDAATYTTPVFITLRAPLTARDQYGRLLMQLDCADRLTLDSTVDANYAGDYIIDKSTVRQFAQEGGANSGEIELKLLPYDETNFIDETDEATAGWLTIGDLDITGENDFTMIDLADGGQIAIASGSAATGTSVAMPDGFTPNNFLLATGPGGFLPAGSRQMHGILLCEGDSSRTLTLTYSDGNNSQSTDAVSGSRRQWHGDVNYFLAAFNGSSETTETINGVTFLHATLSGGEQIVIGHGTMANGATITLPTGFSTAQMYAIAEPHDCNVLDCWWSGGVKAYIDSSFAVHVDYGHNELSWHGNAAVLIFAWKNNSGNVVSAAVTNGSFMTLTLASGMKFGVGVQTLANGAKFEVPAAAGVASTLQLICSPATFDATWGHAAAGVRDCYVDSSNVMHMSFQDNNSTPNTQYASATVFALYCENSTAAIGVSVAPASATVNAGSTQQYAATVTGSSTTAVTWYVDNIAGGSSTVGTISTAGLYTAPSTAGAHTIKAVSTADNTASGSVTVYVVGSDGVVIVGVN